MSPWFIVMLKRSLDHSKQEPELHRRVCRESDPEGQKPKGQQWSSAFELVPIVEGSGHLAATTSDLFIQLLF